MGYLEKKIVSQNLKDRVHLLRRLRRGEIISILDKSDVFVMISSDEVFGLVYLEAMARGCIVIASENDGMQGITQNGENGFLIPAGEVETLTMTINLINDMSHDQRRKISENGMRTALSLTDKKVARYYLGRIKQLATGVE